MVRETAEEKTEGQFNESFREGDSIYVSSNPDIVFEKTIVLDFYNKNTKFGKLEKLQKILAESYKL